MAPDKGTLHHGVVIKGEMRAGYDKILSPEALDFVVELERRFGPERRRLLARRAELQQKLDQGWRPDFLPETRKVRESDWTVAPVLGSGVRSLHPKPGAPSASIEDRSPHSTAAPPMKEAPVGGHQLRTGNTQDRAR